MHIKEVTEQHDASCFLAKAGLFPCKLTGGCQGAKTKVAQAGDLPGSSALQGGGVEVCPISSPSAVEIMNGENHGRYPLKLRYTSYNYNKYDYISDFNWNCTPQLPNRQVGVPVGVSPVGDSTMLCLGIRMVHSQPTSNGLEMTNRT